MVSSPSTSACSDRRSMGVFEERRPIHTFLESPERVSNVTEELSSAQSAQAAHVDSFKEVHLARPTDDEILLAKLRAELERKDDLIESHLEQLAALQAREIRCCGFCTVFFNSASARRR